MTSSNPYQRLVPLEPIKLHHQRANVHGRMTTIVDTSFIPTEPVPDTNVVIPRVVPLRCHRGVLSRSRFFENKIKATPQGHELTCSYSPETTLMILIWLYTGKASPVLLTHGSHFETIVHLYESAVYHHDMFDLGEQIEQYLIQFHVDQRGDGCDIKHFLEVVYGPDTILPEDIRRRMIQPHVIDYVNRLCCRFSAEGSTKFNFEATAGLIRDMLEWQNQATHSMQMAPCLQLMANLAPTCVSGQATAAHFESVGYSEDSSEDLEADMEDVSGGMNQMALD